MNTVVLFIVWASVFVDALKFSLKDNGKPSHWNNKLTDIVNNKLKVLKNWSSINIDETALYVHIDKTFSNISSL